MSPRYRPTEFESVPYDEEVLERAKPVDPRALKQIRDFTYGVLAKNAGKPGALAESLAARVPPEYSHLTDYWRAFNAGRGVSAKKFEASLYEPHFKRKRLAKVLATSFNLTALTPNDLGLNAKSLSGFSPTRMKELSEEAEAEKSFGWAAYFVLAGHPGRARKFFQSAVSGKRRVNKEILANWGDCVDALRSGFHSVNGWRAANGLATLEEHGFELKPLKQRASGKNPLK